MCYIVTMSIRRDGTLFTAGVCLAVGLTGCSGGSGSPESAPSVAPRAAASTPEAPQINAESMPIDHRYGVGRVEWVKITEKVIQHYRNDDELLKPGSKCVMLIGASLAAHGKYVTYEDSGNLGTECPDGAVVNVSLADAKAQDQAFIRYEQRKQQTTRKVLQLESQATQPAKIVDALGYWVTLVNPTPVYTAEGDYRYGDTCMAPAKAEDLGQISPGTELVRAIAPHAVGSVCPTSALFEQSNR
jgi:hypothetical protein